MKKLILPLIFLFLIFPGCSSSDVDEVENPVTYSQLPSVAQKFLSDYFGGKDNYLKGQEIKADNLDLYEVDTVDGFKITFNSYGYWQEVDAPADKTIPTGFIPEPIVQVLNYSYHGYGIVEINTQGENYHIVLSNNQGGESIDLLFNQSGDILSTGDMD